MTPEQAELASALHKMLSATDDPWPKLAEMGVTSLATEATPADLVVACEELGHHAVLGPAAESLAAVPVLLTGLPRCDELARDEWITQLAAGEMTATLAAPPHLPFAADANITDGRATGLVLVAEEGTVSVGALGARHQCVDPARSLHDVRPVCVLALDASEAIGRALEFGTLACAAYLLGAGRALLEMSVRHSGMRTQFGRPVGANQAVQHRLADVAIGLEFARPLLDAAAESLSPRDVSAAKVACADSAYRAARAALQVHGAIGYTTEHEVSRFLLKVRALVGAWGSQSWHRTRIVESL
jgi:alkylation response protein AidB-like acyl-CoA dehydrogenase